MLKRGLIRKVWLTAVGLGLLHATFVRSFNHDAPKDAGAVTTASLGG